MQPAQMLQGKVARGEAAVGLLVTDHLWIDLIEIAAKAGLDYLIIDMEHGAASTDLVADVCRVGRQIGFPILLRPRSNDYAALRHAIDLGPCGFLLACVESAAELDVVRDAIYVPPRGRRRPGGPGNRWVPGFGADDWRRTVEDHFLVWPQIETRRGLSQREAIARHELTTALAVGPYDLSAELGCCGDFQAPELQAALRQILEAARMAGKPGWMIGSDAAGLARDGWNFVCLGEPSWILQAALRERVAQTQAAVRG
uniref:HpcH/HpaI aldolase/citrate lyase domain-containing protein n=1 Tax=Schlesneria paludicola TaxID=360056 RepID=A0A7C4QWH3_9PLAN